MATLRKIYLVVYNTVQLSLWILVALRLCQGALHSSPTALTLYRLAAHPARLGQKLAWLEVFHAAIGLGGGVTTAFIQNLGRYVLLYAVVSSVELVQESWVVVVLLAAWGVGDIMRYSFYIAGLAGGCPPWLLWLRYSLFVVLYPVGITAEWWIYWISLGVVDERGLHAVRMPNEWNFAFDFGIWNRFVLVIYVYFGPFMLAHMMRQRRKKIK